ncbi:MAG: aldo/keto reductase [Akkermansia sp.]
MSTNTLIFGTGQIPEGEACINAVLCALEAGYRHIDTAAIYDNERSVGEAIRRSGIPREEIFITSKLHYKKRGRATAKRELAASLERLGLDYLDRYLVHWPANAYADPERWENINATTWRGMEDNFNLGLAKSIGVSNFLIHHIETLFGTAKIKPAVNQIEFHAGYAQPDLVAFCKLVNIPIQAWSPLGCGEMLTQPLIAKIAQKHGKTAAQICLRWCLQHGITPVVKSITPERILSNRQIFDFELNERDMQSIDHMPLCAYSGMDPDYLL